ncbi:MAG: hypothetical protein PHY46_02520 [Candidatus Omnitrophica bacterium]|nr:hypothetical protein [Candidatus Omnitrophota bacterium]MDD5356233.1 hypothetical protein [Candidatus Omnitrophota bacterium]
MIKIIGIIAAIVLPFWNIPLIARIEKRKSSKDISLYWVFGVWICFILMLPSALVSTDIVFKLFSIVNIILFSLVAVETIRYR